MLSIRIKPFFLKAASVSVAACMLLGAACGCSKSAGEVREEIPLSEDEIVFRAWDFVAGTKAVTPVIGSDDLPALRVSATFGAGETSLWNNAPFTLQGGYYTGGKYWTASNKGYHFYASNNEIAYSAGGSTVLAVNTKDVVCAYLPDPRYKLPNELTFEHIFARLGEVTVTAEDGYTISDIVISIVPKTGGTFNMKTGAGQTDGTGWSSVSTGSATTVANAVGANANDLYLVPGTYTVTASWKAGQTGTSEKVTFSGRSLDIALVGGKINKFNAVLGGEIVFGYTLAPWGDPVNQSVTVAAPLTFEVQSAGTVLWKTSDASFTRTIEYSKDNGATWTALIPTTAGASVTVSAGDRLIFRGGNFAYADASKYCSFGGTAVVRVYGDVTSLLAAESRASLAAYAFRGLFRGFAGLRNHGYLKIGLPSATLNTGCYQEMFYGCTGLGVAPELPVTTLAGSCYASMFQGCTALSYGPDLPASTLASSCYKSMFQGCTAMKSAPYLPATALVSGCYESMFNGCAALNHIQAMFTTTPSDSYTKTWVTGVSASGSFFKSAAASWTNTGVNAVPSGWSVKSVSE